MTKIGTQIKMTVEMGLIGIKWAKRGSIVVIDRYYLTIFVVSQKFQK